MPTCTLKELLLAVVIPPFSVLVEKRYVCIVTSLEKTKTKPGLDVVLHFPHYTVVTLLRYHISARINKRNIYSDSNSSNKASE